MEEKNNRQHVSTAWKEIYQEHPEIYSINNPGQIWRMRYRDFARIIKRLTRNQEQPLSILEAGCGSGRDAFYFASAGHIVTALDAVQLPLDKIADASKTWRRKFPGKGFNLKTSRGDIFEMPFENESFQLVFNSGVIEHFDKIARKNLLIEMHRLTKPDGLCVVIFPNKEHVLEKWWEMLIARYTDFKKWQIPENNILPCIESEMKEAGFANVKLYFIDSFYTLNHYPETRLTGIIAFLLTLVCPSPPFFFRKKLGTRIMAVGEKTDIVTR